MKFWSSQMAGFLEDKGLRRNGRTLLKLLLFIVLVVVLYSLVFHLIMAQVEGRRHPWFAGPYFVLVTMSTLGFGDIVFESTLGQIFSVWVLLSGIVLLLSVLPFMFIRLVYVPWLEKQGQQKVPRSVPATLRGHVIICAWDAIAPGLVSRLSAQQIPHVVIEPDPEIATRLHQEKVPVVLADREDRLTYEAVGACRARLLLANVDDIHNTNIALTVREVAADLPIVAIADQQDSVDILEMAGASQVVHLKQRLGEQLAIRVNAGHAQTHVIGSYQSLLIAEFPAHRTPLAGKTVRETRLRESIGLNVVGIWERGRLVQAGPDTPISQQSVLVALGTDEQMAALDELMIIYDPNPHPVIVLGGGKVGRAAAATLRKRNIPVHIVEKNEALREAAEAVADRVLIGDAADRRCLEAAGIDKAPSVVLTAHDDALNVYLAVYCRKLNPELRIVSRITHERNVEAVHRAGADLVLSHASLGVGTTLAALQGREAVLIGEGVDLYTVPVPAAVTGRTLTQSAIGARTGLNVIAVRHAGEVTTNPPAEYVLPEGSELLVLGSAEQIQALASLKADENGRGRRRNDERAA
jgi:voltage-gated potassium channel